MQAQDIFTRFFVEAFDDREKFPGTTGFQAFFGDPANGSRTVFAPDSLVVDIDIVRGNEKTAKLITRGEVTRPLGATQKNMLDGKFSSFSRKYPLALDEGDITAGMLLQRAAGELPYSSDMKIDRLRKYARDFAMESARRHIRMFELLAAQSILTGVQDAIIGTANADLKYDFERNAANTITVGTAWSNVAAPVLSDLDGGALKIRTNGKATADMAVMGATALVGFKKNTQVLAEANNRGYSTVMVGTDNPVPAKFNRFIAGGMTPQAQVTTPEGRELWIFSYVNGGYTNDAGAFTSFLGADQVLIADSEVRRDRYFGPPEYLPMLSADNELYEEYFGFAAGAPPVPITKSTGNVIDPNMFHYDAYRSQDRSRVTMRVQSAPIFAPTWVDATALLDTTP